MSPGTRVEVRIDEVLYGDGDDPYEPKWAIAVESDGTSHLLYGIRHMVPLKVGMRAVMERTHGDRWILIETV